VSVLDGTFHTIPTVGSLWGVSFCSRLNPYRGKAINSITAKSVLAGTTTSHLKGFLLAKHTAHKNPHHDEPFSPPAAWF
jgi:hypothetical protein